MGPFISIIIPNYNGAATIEKCLQAAFASDYDNFEVVVIDDCSTDKSIEIISRFPCLLIRLESNQGAARARNIGARNSGGDILFFTDADCLLKQDALAIAAKTISRAGTGVIVGGTYTKIPYDRKFFSIFQSVYIHYSELKNREDPDYIATHALVIERRLFERSGGFPEDFMPILEDVAFSHGLRKAGGKLIMEPRLQVEHIFNYSFIGSIKNAFRKSKYWTAYSLTNKDILSDSGTASWELKTTVLSCLVIWIFLVIGHFVQRYSFLYASCAVFWVNIVFNRKLLMTFYETRGLSFTILAALYYTMLYPIPVGAGAVSGMMMHVSGKRR